MQSDPHSPPAQPLSSPVRLGVVGAGAWCRAAHLPSLGQDPNVRLTAVASGTRRSAQEAAAAHAIERVHDTWHELVADDLDAVLITAPAVHHAEIAVAAFEHGKHVFCDAPLAMSADEARTMLSAAESAGRQHAYGLPRPFLYGGAEFQRLLAGGAIGTPQSATLSVRGNGWLLADPAIQWRARADAVPPLLIGVVVGVLGELFGDVARVCARLERIAPAAGDGTHVPAPDFFSAQFDFRSGLRATIDAGVSPAPVPGSGLSVFGSEGMLVWDWTKPGSIVEWRTGAEAHDRSVALADSLPAQYTFSRAFVQALLTGQAPTPNFAGGLRELLVIEACQASARSKAWVDVGPDRLRSSRRSAPVRSE